MHHVFEIEEPLDSIFRSVHSLCLLWVNAVESVCDALWSSLFTFCVCSYCALHSLQWLDDPWVCNQCHISISHLFAEFEEDNEACWMWKSLLWKDEWEWVGRRSWWFSFVYLASKATRRYIPHQHWEFLSREVDHSGMSWPQHILKSLLIFAAPYSLLLQTFWKIESYPKPPLLF